MLNKFIPLKLECKGFPGGKVLKNSPANAGDAGDPGSTSGLEDPLKEEMATLSSILAWRMLWTGEPGGLPSTESQRSGTQLSD